MATPPVPTDSGGSIQWQAPATTGDDDSARTTRSATFNADGREFTVTVSYSRAAVMAKYGISNEEVDATMKQVITRIGADQLKNLAGHSISTSLSGAEQLQYKASSETSYHAFSPDLQRSNPTLFNTINTVRSVFGMNRETLTSVPSMSGERARGVLPGGDGRHASDDSISLDVHERGSPAIGRGRGATVDDLDDDDTNFDDYDTPPVQRGTDSASTSSAPTVRFAPVSESARGQTTGFVSLAQGFANSLLQGNPIVRRLDVIDTILFAHSFAPDPRAAVSAERFHQSAGEIAVALSDPDLNLTRDHQNEVLKHLPNPYLADAVRVRLGLQGPRDVFLDFSQGQMKISGQPEGVGQFACASICGEAIYAMILKQRGMDNRDILDRVLKNGIERHVRSAGDMASTPQSSRVFDQVFSEIEQNYTEYADQKGFDSHLERTDIFEDFSSEVQKMGVDDYIVVTARQRSGLEDSVMGSILLFKNTFESDDDQWCVMDSHSSSVRGASRGASIRSFDSPDNALAYVKSHYNLEEEHRIDKVSLVENEA